MTTTDRQPRRTNMNPDAAITAIVNAANPDAARAFCDALGDRTLHAIADLLYVDASGRRPKLIDRIVTEARA